MSDEPEVIADLRCLYEGKVDWLTTECATTGVNISDILAAYDTLRARLAAAERVVEAAKAWVRVPYEDLAADKALMDAVNALTTEDA